MPLPKSTPRKLLHTRVIQLRGYEREDGLIDIEAHMTDTKPYTFSNIERGTIPAGDPLHEMWLRLTIDQSLTIQAVQAAMDSTPHSVCPAIIPNFQRLVGISIAKGFLKAAAQQLGGIDGCTHLRELLAQMGTVAYQTMFSIRGHRKPEDPSDPTKPRRIPAMLLNTCHTYSETGPLAVQHAAEGAAD
jgi:hypothetical protein